MHWLETKIPPPVVAAILGVVAWRVARALPSLALDLPDLLRGVPAALLAATGLALDATALRTFFAARTTVSPLDPSRTSALVERGLYRFTRNPMYLGLLLILAGWTIWLDHALAFVVLPGFVFYITRFQIVPEERALRERFGDGFSHYAARVSRWL